MGWTREQVRAYCKRRYDERRREGVCVRCGENPAEFGRVHCERCRLRRLPFSRGARAKDLRWRRGG